MADWDQGSPADNDVVSSFPANERAARSAAKTNFGIDHVDTPGATVGRHKQITLLAAAAPIAVAGWGIIYTDVAGDLWYKNIDGTAIQLTVGDVAGDGGPTRLPDQGSSPVPISGGFIYCKVFEGQSELYFLDSEDNEIRLTYKGELAVDLSATDLTVGSLRTNSFLRGKVVTVPTVAGTVTIDWEAGTTYRVAITETTDVEFVNMPDTVSGEEQAIYLDVEMTGVQTVTLSSAFTILIKDGVNVALTEDGRDYIGVISNDGATITVIPYLNMVTI